MMKEEHHIFKGMRRDNHQIKQDPSFLWDALNIRITSRDDNTLLSITNEKGQEDIGPSFSGSYLGHCVIGKFIILFIQYEMNFGTYNGLKIIRLTNTNQYPNPTGGDFKWKFDTLFDGINEDSTFNNPISQIEAIGYYESELVQKVYWIDGKSQPKVINIAQPELLFTGIPGLINKDYDSGLLYMGINYSHPNPTSSSSAEKKLAELYPNGIWPKGYKTFDFVQTLNLREDVSVTKTYESGSFSPGTIQYAFTYYNRYGAESKIFYTTGLYYISHKDRGGSPEETISNRFKINISSCDDFEYVRIYSIHRTSIDAVPTVKLVSDVKVVNGNIQYTDNGTSGHVVDNSLLLYIGGVSIIPKAMAIKDRTIFFGNILLKSQNKYSNIKKTIQEGLSNKNIKIDEKITYVDSFKADYIAGKYYSYLQDQGETLSASEEYKARFKSNEYYRCGVQVQTIDGEWSSPIHLGDIILNESFPGVGNVVNRLTKQWIFSSKVINKLYNLGVRRIRPCVVFPSPLDYEVICQGVLSPTVYNVNCRKSNAPYVQSSWFFRPSLSEEEDLSIGNKTNIEEGAVIEYTHNKPLLSGGNRGAEIQNMHVNSAIKNISGITDPETYREWFFVDSNIVTMHSPDIEFNDSVQNIDWSNTELVILGPVVLESSIGDISITTSSPTLSSSATGFTKHTIGRIMNESDNVESFRGGGLISGIFYNDAKIWYTTAGDSGSTPTNFLIYPWHRSGSLNNDSTRGDGQGARTAVLSRKIISNLRFSAKSVGVNNNDLKYEISTPQLFNSNEVSLVNVRVPYLKKDVSYYGNVDYLVTCKEAYNIYTADSFTGEINAIVDDTVPYIRDSRDPVRMKYKSTPHLVFSLGKEPQEELEETKEYSIDILPKLGPSKVTSYDYKIPEWDPYYANVKYKVHQNLFYKDVYGVPKPSYLLLGEIRRKWTEESRKTKFGGDSPEALMENLWFPAAETTMIELNKEATIRFDWGDTWYSRYDCLKTYPFTQEDENSVVEIASFMCETRTNIDGRYDKNRGQLSNLYMTPQNFNKINNVYSQKDNFFNYRILDDIYYRNNRYPNQITWSLEKTSSSDTDPWTHITLANTLDMDGTKGEITSLNTWNEYLLCFQEEALSNVMFNSRAQIPVSDGVPIEIANGYKVDGSRLLGNIGCTYKKSIATTPAGVYFKDTKNTGSIWLFNGQLTNLSQSKGMDQWAKKHKKLNTFYDKEYRDVYFIVPYGGRDDALCYSEVLGEFTSFFSYGPSLEMLNFDNRFMSIMAQPRSYPYGLDYVRLCENNSGSYNYFYDSNYNISSTPWYLSFISNQDPSATKIFDTVELRSEYYAYGGGSEVGYCPVNEISVENEYQSSQAIGPNMNSRHKFRIWRINIPRSTKVASSNGTDTTRPTYGRSRIRNPWTMIKLGYNGDITGDTVTPNGKAVIHDVTVKYTV